MRLFVLSTIGGYAATSSFGADFSKSQLCFLLRCGFFSKQTLLPPSGEVARSADRGQKARHIERKRNIPPNNRNTHYTVSHYTVFARKRSDEAISREGRGLRSIFSVLFQGDCRGRYAPSQ